MNKWTLATLAFALAPLQVTFAHHSNAPHYDANKPVSIEGVVSDFKFVNPHVVIFVDMANEDGTVSTWNCAYTAATALRRNGWSKDLFSAGDFVRIQGSAARRDPHGCWFTGAVLEDGRRISRRGVIDGIDTFEIEAVTAPDGPDRLSANWRPAPRTRGRGGPGGAGEPRGRTSEVLTEAGEAALENYDQRFDDPSLECSSASIIRVWPESGMVNQIEVLDDEIIIRHQYMDTVRTLHLNAGMPPDDYEPSMTGYSVAHFDGPDLVIQTTGFKAGVLRPHPGTLHSDEMRVDERLILSEDGSELRRDYVVTDPRYFKEPYTGTSTWLRTNLPLTSYDCVELGGVSNIRIND